MYIYIYIYIDISTQSTIAGEYRNNLDHPKARQADGIAPLRAAEVLALRLAATLPGTGLRGEPGMARGNSWHVMVLCDLTTI